MRTLYKHILRSHLWLTEMYFAVPNRGDVHFIRLYVYAFESREIFLMLARRRWRFAIDRAIAWVSRRNLFFFFFVFPFRIIMEHNSPFYRLPYWRSNSIVNEMALFPTSKEKRDEPLFSLFLFNYVTSTLIKDIGHSIDLTEALPHTYRYNPKFLMLNLLRANYRVQITILYIHCIYINALPPSPNDEFNGKYTL